jgi:arginyl-tRNA synthetase
MNQWVYEGFEQTYSRLGIGFDRNYYESKTYLLGKSLVLKGLDQGLFRRDDTGAVWADLQEEGLDSKVLLRGDGTSVYITQDLGTAEQRQEDWAFDRMIYTVANEQDYHFKVLFALLRKLGFPWAASCQHLSYGMVDLPHGRMKSREGTVVDADDLMDEVEAMATAKLEQSEKLSDQSRAELEQLAREIGLAALKFYILKVDPTKRMVYNPEEAIDLQGHTGPFVQYAHARICSVLAKAENVCKGWEVKEPWSLDASRALHEEELQLLRTFSDFSEQVHQAASRNNPSLVADFAYRLATAFNRFYHECPVLQEASEETRAFRLALCLQTRDLLALSLDLLGITAPLRM